MRIQLVCAISNQSQHRFLSNILITFQNRAENEEQTHQGWLNSLRLLYPVRMLIRVYSLCILFWDLFWLILYSVGYVLKAAKEVIIPPPLKSVSNEIIMVNIPTYPLIFTFQNNH